MTKSRRKGVEEAPAPFGLKPPFDRPLTAKELAAMPDETIDTSDIPELDEEWFRKAEVRPPRVKEAVSIRLDPDVLEFFRAQGAGYQTRINAVLRAYMESVKK